MGPLREFKLPPLDFAYDAGRGQYASIAVLKMLLREFPDTAWKMLAVTD